jgi:TatD DNase family protein
MKLPIIIHSREAESDVLRIIEELKFDNIVVFHCYTGNSEDAVEILNRGYYLSFSGIITFKKAEYLREIVSMVPLDRLFSETDSPYLAPEPFRGKTNSPIRVKLVADRIASIKGVDVKDVNNSIKRNFEKVIT